MDERTLGALRGSIARWERIVAGEAEGGPSDCQLCELFSDVDTLADDDCCGCPVREETGKPHCWNTPYDDWWVRSHVILNSGLKRVADTPEAVKAAEAMRDYLKSLLPAGEQEKI